MSLLLLLFTFSGLTCAENNSSKTVIVGAGLSGLSAAAHLEQNGDNDYVILEATDRVGGRVKTVIQQQDGIDYALDLGAGWINGNENPLYEIAVENDLLKENDWSHQNTSDRFIVGKTEFREDDTRLIPEQTWREVYDFYGYAMTEVASFYTEGLPDGYNDESSVEMYILDRFYEIFNGTSDEELWEQQRKVIETLLLFETWPTGCHSMDEVSLKYFGSYINMEGGDVTLPRGYETVTDAMKKNIPEDKIKVNHVVEKITYSTDKSTATVLCENGQTYEAQHIVVTSSVGFLKSNAATMFDPSLSGEKMAAIERIGYGTTDRIYLEFENLDFIDDQEVGTVFFARMPEDHADPTIWQNKIIFCYATDVPRNNILTCWVTGEQAEEMETKTDEEVLVRMREVLTEFLGTEVPVPLNMIRSTWGSDEFYKGVYSFIEVGSSVDDIKALAEPIYYSGENNEKPLILFAGEATDEKYYGSAHAAYLSGIREAKRIMDSDYSSVGKPKLNMIAFIFVAICKLTF